jgi:hypothetical protein
MEAKEHARAAEVVSSQPVQHVPGERVLPERCADHSLTLGPRRQPLGTDALDRSAWSQERSLARRLEVQGPRAGDVGVTEVRCATHREQPEQDGPRQTRAAAGHRQLGDVAEPGVPQPPMEDGIDESQDAVPARPEGTPEAGHPLRIPGGSLPHRDGAGVQRPTWARRLTRVAPDRRPPGSRLAHSPWQRSGYTSRLASATRTGSRAVEGGA